MRRAISIVFTLLAGIVVWVHAVVPHHHHNKVFTAIVQVFDEDTQQAFRHTHHTWTHRHDTEELSLLEFKCQLQTFLLAIIQEMIDEVIVCPVSIFRPYVAGMHTEYVARSMGLRAPPIIC